MPHQASRWTLTTLGDLLYMGANGLLSRLGAGVAGSRLQSGGPGVAPLWSTAGSALLLASVAPSATIDNTAVRTVFNSTYTVGASTLAVGDVLQVQASGTWLRAGAQTAVFDLSFGGTALATTAAITSASGDWFISANLTVRTIGVGGVASFASDISAKIAAVAGSVDNDVDGTNPNTTIDNVLGIALTCSAGAAGTGGTLQRISVVKLS